MGALNIHLDQKTKDRIELLKANGAEGNSSIQNLADLALNDQMCLIQMDYMEKLLMELEGVGDGKLYSLNLYYPILYSLA